jgi:hypothetical protein
VRITCNIIVFLEVQNYVTIWVLFESLSLHNWIPPLRIIFHELTPFFLWQISISLLTLKCQGGPTWSAFQCICLALCLGSQSIVFNRFKQKFLQGSTSACKHSVYILEHYFKQHRPCILCTLDWSSLCPLCWECCQRAC